MAQDTSRALRSPCLDLVVVIIYRLSGLSADHQYLINLVRECQRAEVCRGQSRKQLTIMDITIILNYIIVIIMVIMIIMIILNIISILSTW